MKRLLLVLPLMAGMVLLPFGSPFVSAQEEQQENRLSADAGILPDSPLYFLDKLGKSLSLLFAIGQDAKAQASLGFSDERLAEALIMADQNKTGPLTTAARGYENFIAIAVKQAGFTRQMMVTDLDEEVALALAGHLEDIDTIEDHLVESAPPNALDSLSAAKESSIRGLTSVLQGLALGKPELAAEINLKAAESRLSRATALAVKLNPDAMRIAVEQGETLLTFATQIAEIAKQYNSGAAAVEASITRAKTRHYNLLTSLNESISPQVRELVNTEIEDAIKNASVRSTPKH